MLHDWGEAHYWLITVMNSPIWGLYGIKESHKIRDNKTIFLGEIAIWKIVGTITPPPPSLQKV